MNCRLALAKHHPEHPAILSVVVLRVLWGRWCDVLRRPARDEVRSLSRARGSDTRAALGFETGAGRRDDSHGRRPRTRSRRRGARETSLAATRVTTSGPNVTAAAAEAERSRRSRRVEDMVARQGQGDTDIVSVSIHSKGSDPRSLVMSRSGRQLRLIVKRESSPTNSATAQETTKCPLSHPSSGSTRRPKRP
jgi:hypothetical protein